MNNKTTTRFIALLTTALVVFGSGCAATRPKEGAEPPQRTLESVSFQGSSIITDVSRPVGRLEPADVQLQRPVRPLYLRTHGRSL